jgi:hypothetical protein
VTAVKLYPRTTVALDQVAELEQCYIKSRAASRAGYRHSTPLSRVLMFLRVSGIPLLLGGKALWYPLELPLMEDLRRQPLVGRARILKLTKST